MKYLVVTRLYFEADNNTPSAQVWTEVAELEHEELARVEKDIINDFKSDTNAEEIEVDFIPLSDLEREWRKISERW
jgi:hypothetical protein